MIKTLTPHARVIMDDTRYTLVSYSTVVCTLDFVNGDILLACTGTYSPTTRRHIARFMREFTEYDYFTAKSIAGEQVFLSLVTGEIIPW